MIQQGRRAPSRADKVLIVVVDGLKTLPTPLGAGAQ